MTRKLLLTFTVIITFTISNAQEKWGSIDKNTVTMRELPPLWPGCEETSGDPSAMNNCFATKLSKHIAQNFKYPPEAYKNNDQGTVVVDFEISIDGTVKIVSISGGSEALQAEARRNILEIPQMKPGMLAGEPRAISYQVPFHFKTGK